MLKSIYSPRSRFIPTKTNKRMKETEKEIQKLLQKIISSRKKNLSEGSKDDFLSTLMESISDEQQLIDDCKLFYFAGKDSTSMLLVWTMFLLSKHQDWQVSACQEVLDVFGCTDQPHFDGLCHLKIVTMILYEVLRLYPPAISLKRYVHEETKLGNLSLPAGTLINLALLVAHLDREVCSGDSRGRETRQAILICIQCRAS